MLAFTMSPQAWTIVFVYILLSISTMAIAIKNKTFKPSGSSVFGCLCTLLAIGIMTFDTDCLTSGSCEIWSWIRTILYIIVPVIAILVLLKTKLL